MSFPAAVSGVTLPSVPVPALTVTVQRNVKTSLIRFVGGAAASVVKARATAGLNGAVPAECVYVLDPSAPNAFLANNGATVAVTGCVIAVNSTNSQAAAIYGGASVTASELVTVGGCNCTGTYPTLMTGQTPVADPFAALPAPTIGACTFPTMYIPGSGTTLQPGTYCGGITVSNGVTGVTFAPGIYIIKGGGLIFGGGITTSGSGVMFYLTGTNATYASVTIANGVNVTFSAPTSGPYQGVLFFQDRSITSNSNATFAGGASMSLSGSLYFPTTNLAFSNGVGGASSSTALIAKQISFVGGAKIQYDPTGLLTGLVSKAVALMQ
jgi:hypothetical protein